MPIETKDELAIQHILSRLALLQGGIYHTTVNVDNITDEFRNPLEVYKSSGSSGFPLVQVVGPHRTDFLPGTTEKTGWNRLNTIQANTDLEIYCAVLGPNTRTKLLRLRQDIFRVLSNDFTLGGNVHNWQPVAWEAGYSWEKQSGAMGTAIVTLRLIWTYEKATPV